MLYLINSENACGIPEEPIGEEEAVFLLLQDGVYLSSLPESGDVYACAEDVRLRGLSGRLPERVKPVSAAEMVELIVAHPVMSLM